MTASSISTIQHALEDILLVTLHFVKLFESIFLGGRHVASAERLVAIEEARNPVTNGCPTVC